MSLFDDNPLLGLVGAIVAAPFEIVGGVAKITAETIVETTNAIAEEVVTGDEHTSYHIRDDAEKIIKEANADLWDARHDLEYRWELTADEAKEVARMRSEVYGLVKLEIRNSSVPELPSVWQVQPGNIYLPALDEFSFNFGTALGVLGIDERKEAAEEYLRKANRYQAKVADKIVECKELERIARNISNHQQEELKMLGIIRRMYKEKSQSVLMETEDGLRKLAELCNQRLSEATDRSYGELLQKLKSLWM